MSNESQTPLPRSQRFNVLNDDACDEKSALGGRAVGATNRTLPRRNAVERSNLRPFGIKGYFGSNRRTNVANALRRPTRNCRQVATIAAPLAPNENGNPAFERPQTVEATSIDANCEPRVKRRANRKSRSRSPPPVPTRVSTIKYLALQRRKRRGKFYLLTAVRLNLLFLPNYVS